MHRYIGFRSFVRVMTSTGRPTTIRAEISNVRDRATSSLQHQMLLPDGALGKLVLAHCFAVKLAVSSNAAIRNVVGLAFCLQSGNGAPGLETEIAVTLRHKDYRRCAVGSLALHLFCRFHVCILDRANCQDNQTRQHSHGQL